MPDLNIAADFFIRWFTVITIISTIAAAAMSWWIKSKEKTWGPPAQAAIQTTAAMVVIFAALRIVSLTSAPTSADTVDAKIKDWTYDMKLKFGPEDDPNAAFHISITMPSGRTLNVVRAKGMSFVGVVGMMKVDQELLKKAHLSREKVEQVRVACIREAMRQRIGLIKSPAPFTLTDFTFESDIPVTGLTEFEFAMALGDVDRVEGAVLQAMMAETGLQIVGEGTAMGATQ